MVRLIEWMGIAQGVLALGAIAWALRAMLRPKGVTGCCPGPRKRLALLRRRRCGYPLAGLWMNPAGRCRCPECGTEVAPEGRRRARGARRGAIAAIVLAASGTACWKVRWIREGNWVHGSPTCLLVASQYVCPGKCSWLMTSELSERVQSGVLSRREREWVLRLAVHSLRDDDVKWNAEWGEGIIQELGEEAVPALERSLWSDDYQQRQIAANLLERLCDRGRELAQPELEGHYRPSGRLLAVAVEGLADDEGRGKSRDFWRARVWNARDGAGLLSSNFERSRELLLGCLQSADSQQRFLAAAILGIHGDASAGERVARELSAHLASNDTPADACIASGALYRLGVPALAFVRPLMDSADPQERDTARLIALDIEHANSPLSVRRALNRISCAVQDPVVVADPLVDSDSWSR